MLIKKWMSKNVTAVQANDSVIKAKILLKDHSISRLPVMEKGRLIGIVTGWDLKRILPSETLKVKNVMIRDPITVPLDFTVEEVAEVLLDNKISWVPVIDHDGEVAGIITRTDVLGVLVKVTGVRKKGIQFALQVKDRPGVVKETVDIVRMHGGRIVSIIISDERVSTGYRRIYIRISGIDRFNLGRLQDALGEIGGLIYTVDRLDVVWGIDYDREIALVAIQESQADEKIMGVARVISGVNRRRAEFSIVTGDPWQGKGIGTELLGRCLKIAKEHGIEAVSGSVLYENTQMLALGKKMGFGIKKAPESGVYELNLDPI